MKKIFLVLLAALVSSTAISAPSTNPPIKIGEMFCYTGCPDVAEAWKNGWQMSLKEINKSGGVLGKPLEVVSRDDKGSPSDTVKNFEELKSRENIKIYFGTLFSHTTLAGSNFAKQNQVLFMRGFDGADELTREQGHNLYFQIGPTSSAVIGPLAEKAAASGKKKWAFIAPDYVAGRTFVEQFQIALKRLNPNVEFVETQYFPYGKLNAGPVAQAIAHAKPDGIFVVAMSGDYARLVREGNKRNLFDNRMMIGPICGSSYYIRPLGKEAPVGWLSAQGYPAEQITDPTHKKFIDDYNKMFGEFPEIGSFVSYSSLKILAEAINATGNDDPKKVAEVLRQKQFSIPNGTLTFRADGLSNFGSWIGKTGFYNGVPTILNPEYIKSEKYLPTAEDNLKAREKKQP